MCHVTKYSTIRGVFQQPWPGVSPTAILNEEKALGTRLSSAPTGDGERGIRSDDFLSWFVWGSVIAANYTKT